MKSLTPCLLLEQGNIEEFDTLSASLVKKVLPGTFGHADQNRDPNERGRGRDGSFLAAESPTWAMS